MVRHVLYTSNAALVGKDRKQKQKVWVGCTVIFLLSLLSYAAFPDFGFFVHETRGIFGKAPIAQELCKEDYPWWEADDCQCEASTCLKPSLTFQGLYTNEVRVGGTCGHRAWAAGGGQKVLSYSLFGTNPEYWEGLELILSTVKQFYPGWKVRLYTNPLHRAPQLCPLLHRHSSLFYICDITSLPPPLGNLSSVHPMMWRVVPLGDPQVATMIVRDTDSQVSKREVSAVEEWLASGKMFHVMRDHPFHTMPVMGGMWGARWHKDPTTLRELSTLRNKMITMAFGRARYSHDQIILKAVLWPAMAGRVMAHDSYTCRQFQGSSPWPSQRVNKIFVGSARLRKGYENATVPTTCPEFCRPPAHRDWLYC